MGSSNTTCAISNAPIRPDDKVRLYFLVSDSYVSKADGADKQSVGKGYQCYPWDSYKVLGGISIKAEYADYGNYDFDEDTITAQYLLALIKDLYSENIPEPNVEYNPYHDHMSISADSLDWDKVLRMIHSGRLFFKPRFGGGRSSHIQMMAIHESVFQALKPKSVVRYDHTNRKEVEYTYDHLVDVEKKKIPKSNKLEHIKELMDALIDANGVDFSKLDEKERNKILSQYKVKAEMIITYGDMDSRKEWAFTQNGSSSDYGFAIESTEVVTNEKIHDFVCDAIDTELFNNVMLMSNVLYMPNMGSGQEYDLFPHIEHLKKITKALEEIANDESEYNLPLEQHEQRWQEISYVSLVEKFDELYESESGEMLEKISKYFEHNDVLIIKPEDWDDDEYELYDMVNNKSIELRIYL